MVDPCFVSSDDASQKGVTFVTVAVQNASADGQTVAFVLFCESFVEPTLHTPYESQDGCG
jgi:hypothetical protein